MNRISPTTFWTTLFLAVALLPGPLARSDDAPRSSPDAKSAIDVVELLKPIREKRGLPAIAAAVVKGDRTIAAGATGVRKNGDRALVTIDDAFHLGSNTKSMTATLCAILVEQGKLKWESTVEEIFSNQVDKIHADYRGVTLDQLLRHRSGLPDDTVPDEIVWPKVRALKGPIVGQRRKFVEIVLSRKPAAAPGTKFQYSNAGFTVAGAMCERVTGKSWENLMRELLFKPLGMKTAGFGPPGKPGSLEQPLGHIELFGFLAPKTPGPHTDNPAVIGPAGTVHCSLPDWAKYAAMHLQGAKGGHRLLSQASFQKLQSVSAGEEYVGGWLVSERQWACGKVLFHTGSNSLWMAVVWLAPERDMAFLAATNAGTSAAFPACDDAVSALILKCKSL